jgi:hypothetical protein
LEINERSDMKLTYLSNTFFPFLVPEMDSSFASSVGAHTVYPAGFSLDEALQFYWRAQNYQLVAAGNGVLSGTTQALSVNGLLPPRNASVGTSSYYVMSGFTPVGPGDFVTGIGMRVVVPGTGTITASGGRGTNNAALFNLQVNLFYPEIYMPDPVVQFNGLWYPAMSVSASVTNTVHLTSGGSLSIAYSCSSFAAASTTEIGTFSFFGVSVPVFCAPLHPASGPTPAETRTFSGALTVANEWA